MKRHRGTSDFDLGMIIGWVLVLIILCGVMWYTQNRQESPGAMQNGRVVPEHLAAEKRPGAAGLAPYVGEWLLLANGFEPVQITVVPNVDGQLIGTGGMWILILTPMENGTFSGFVANGANAWIGPVGFAWPAMATDNGMLGAMVIELGRPVEINMDIFRDPEF